MKTCAILWFFLGVGFVKCQIDLEEHFQHCKVNSSNFGDCLKDGINDLRPFFKEGLPNYGIGSFDPFFANVVPQKIITPLFSYKLYLRNVTESGWTASQITKLVTDLRKKEIAVTQFFPDKRLKGQYEFDGTFLGRNIRSKGAWNLSLFDYVQTLTISRRYRQRSLLNLNPPIDVRCQLKSCKNLEMHIENLAGGKTGIEKFLDWIINTAWQPGFVVFSPVINDLVGTAFTEIFNRDFQNFPFEKVFKN